MEPITNNEAGGWHLLKKPTKKKLLIILTADN